MYILYKLVLQMNKLIDSSPESERRFEIRGGGCLFHLMKKMFKLIDRSVLVNLLTLAFAERELIDITVPGKCIPWA